MKILIIGLGSMGKRRIRNLQSIGYKNNIYGFDLRVDRIKEAKDEYNIKIIDSIDNKSITEFSALVISVPPDLHHLYIKLSIENKIPCFVEASVVDTELKVLSELAKVHNILVAPSSTMYFHPAIKLIFDIVTQNKLGFLTNATYHSGQYLPDWHMYENVKDFYVSNKETGGAREIVPFEMTWLVKLLGLPKSVYGSVKKTIHIEGAENIDDTYNALLNYEKFIFNLTVDVTSRNATRNLFLNFSSGQLYWNWDDNYIKIFEVEKGWSILKFDISNAQDGYNKNITEQMYVEELECFLNAIESNKFFVNTLDEDISVLNILYSIEESSKSRKEITI